MRFLTINEKRHVGDGVRGLIDSQNIYGHARVSKTLKEYFKALVSHSNVFDNVNIRGTNNDITKFVKFIQPSLKTAQHLRITIKGANGAQTSCRRWS